MTRHQFDTPGSAAPETLTVSVLGPLTVTVGGAVVTIGGGRLRALLVRLACAPNQRVSATVLVNDLWRDEPPTDPANALQTLVSRLRRCLGDPALVRQESGGYRLVLQPTDLDGLDFEGRVRQGRHELQQGNPREASRVLASALALWRGTALGDVEDIDFADTLTVRWDELRFDAQADLLELRLADDPASVIGELQDLASGHPLRERFSALLITALAKADRVPEALAAYEELRRFLAEELGSDPSSRLQDLHLSLIRGEVPPAPEASPRRTLGNIPAALTTFVGREDDLRGVLQMVTARRLTTVVGPGGAGKTRLAVEVARQSHQDRSQHRSQHRSQQQSEAWPDGVWLIELAPITDEANLDMTLLSTLGLRDPRVMERIERAPTEARQRLIEALESSRCLLVIDNCEHLIEPVALLIDEILKRAPQVRVLATSREPLGLIGEGLCHLGPLALPPLDSSPEDAMSYPAVQLFEDRATAATAEFAIDMENVGQVIDIVRRLDGLPLAIELACSRLRSLPMSEIAQRLSDRFRLLTGGSRASLPRHRTLRAVVDWSWDLLSPAERLLVERLAVFPSGAGLESAMAVCGDDRVSVQEIEDWLLSLVDKSLLQPAGVDPLRYRLLETIREYGAERLAERNEIDQARQAHAEFFSGYAIALEPQLRGVDQLRALRMLNLERDNILAALHYLGDSGSGDAALELGLALFWYWTLIDAPEECASWMQFILQTNQGSDNPDLVYAEVIGAFFSLIGAVASEDGPFDDLEEQTLSYGKMLADMPPPPFLPLALLPTYLIAFTSSGGQIATVVDNSDLSQSEDRWLRAAGHAINAHRAENAGDVATVRREVGQALPLFQQIGDRWGLSNALGARAQVSVLDGDLTGAINDLETALQFVAELGSQDDDVFLQLRLADLHRRLGHRAEAHRHLDAMLALNGTLPGGMDRQYFADAARLHLFLEEDDLASADRLATDLRSRINEAVLPSPGYGHTVAIVYAAIATEAMARGHLAQAGADLSRAYPIAVETADMPIIAAFANTVSLFAASVDRPRDAAILLGAGDAIRGAPDPTDPQVALLTERLTRLLGADFDQLYTEGLELTRADALLRIDPTRLPMSVESTGPSVDQARRR